MGSKDTAINVRISKELKFRLCKCQTQIPPYVIKISAIVTRGIELACAEIERKAKETKEKQ